MLDRHVLAATPRRGLHDRDPVDHVHALADAAKHGVTGLVLRYVVEPGIVRQVDKELRGGRVRVRPACHGKRAADILQEIVRFVPDRLACLFGLHVGVEAAALDDEILHHAMEDGVVVKARVDICKEIGDRERRLVRVELDGETAHAGFEDHFRFRPGGSLC